MSQVGIAFRRGRGRGLQLVCVVCIMVTRAFLVATGSLVRRQVTRVVDGPAAQGTVVCEQTRVT